LFSKESSVIQPALSIYREEEEGGRGGRGRRRRRRRDERG